jgi:hypothetical protein
MFESKPYWWVICDRCRVNGQEGSEYSAWTDPDTALMEAGEDWVAVGVGYRGVTQAHLCGECVIEVRALMGFDPCGDAYEDDPDHGGPEHNRLICPACTTPMVPIEPDVTTARCPNCTFESFPLKVDPASPLSAAVSAPEPAPVSLPSLRLVTSPDDVPEQC